MEPIKTAKDWMSEFKPALDEALCCPDVSPHETVELYFEKIIAYERRLMADYFCNGCKRFGKPDRIHFRTALWSHGRPSSPDMRVECMAWELWETWEVTLKAQKGEKTS